MKMWKEKEIATLRKLWFDGAHAQDIADQLGRSEEAVRRKALYLGYAKRHISRSRLKREEIEIPGWVPDAYRSSYAAIAAMEGEFEAASFARNSLAVDRIMTRMGISQ
jgi:hypothetical protein